jgi:hypothetical protein
MLPTTNCATRRLNSGYEYRFRTILQRADIFVVVFISFLCAHIYINYLQVVSDQDQCGGHQSG